MTTKNKAYYVCAGECGAKLTDQEYKDHPTKTCQSKECSHYQKPFVLNLSLKKCVPCEGGTPPLKSEEIATYKKQVDPAWEVLNNKKIKREFKFKDFIEAMKFVNEVAEIANEEDHHPDIYIYYNKVVLELTTHAIGGLSENDFIIAAKIDEKI